MFSFQGEDQPVVVEGASVPIDSVVTAQAFTSESQDVGREEIRGIDAGMAVRTDRRIKTRRIVAMAVIADESRAGRGLAVGLERITYGLVWKILCVKAGQRGVAAAMVGVADKAFSCLTLSQHDCVKIRRVIRQVRVTGQAVIGHILAFPRASVAGTAVSTDFSVGAYPAQCKLFGLRIQRARAEHAPAPDHTLGNDDQQGEADCYEAQR